MGEYNGTHEMPFLDLAPEESTFLEDALRGLRGNPKALPCKYFYDHRGSRLFERISRLPEYYLTRTELSIMRQYLPSMAREVGPGVRLIEFGTGSGIKTRLLLRSLKDPAVYLPIDISRTQLIEASRELKREFPELPVLPVVSDYTQPFDLPKTPVSCEKTVVYFPGSTIGNFDPREARRFLQRTRRQLGAGGGLLIGFDMVKEIPILEAAYNDEEGVTAEFNLNLLHRLKRELQAEVDVSRFSHLARYDPAEERIEMYLRSESDQVIGLGKNEFRLAAGELIHTENCQKFTAEATVLLAGDAGFRVLKTWSDQRSFFSVQYWQAG